ncbi:MAG: SIS domain-containing protein [Chloroflexia bacterium]|nr:SIS domain-containing protein [Chloroflexia bacterium]
MDLQRLIEEGFQSSIALKQRVLAEQGLRIAALAERWVECLRRGNKILLCGNGGSAADAQHLAAELVNRLLLERPALPAIALTTDTSILTSTANDRDFGQVFARQVQALGRAGDMLFLLSTSGRSPNLLRAVEAARERDLEVLALLGGDGGPLLSLCDLALVVPAVLSPRVQEVHILVGHVLCQVVEEALFGE